MTADNKDRRLSGTHITIIIVALALVLAPTTAYAAASRVISILADPYNSAAYARISEDGRLGVRGETTAQAGVPSNEWHRRVELLPEVPSRSPAEVRLLHGAPAGSGIGVSQLIVSYGAVEPGEYEAKLWLVAKPVEGPVCPAESTPGYRPGTDELVFQFATPHDAAGGRHYEQLVFPVPLTVKPSPTHSMCLYASAISGYLDVTANGVSGPATSAFAPVKGEPADPADSK